MNAHISVLYQEIIPVLAETRLRRCVDLTVGAGGHAWGLLEAAVPAGKLLGLDVDPQALALARERLAEYGERAVLVQASYTTLSAQLGALGWESVDAILLDLGASSMQFDSPDRGFSFREDGPLDMRFDPNGLLTAADIVNSYDERTLADLIYEFGEERRSRQVAHAIVEARPFNSTAQLAGVVAGAVKGPKDSRIHPATRTFQALRIAVNGELDALKSVLPQAVAALAPGGRLAVISFHSLEDRIVKFFFREHSRAEQPSLELLNKKPITAAEEEIRHNPRARSAKLRMVEKL